jgi:tryptophan synthase alpha chain
MNRITALFKKKKGDILSVYFTAGFPKLDDTVNIIRNLEKAGVDMIEIGFPFSDPLADGPVIQQSSTKAIQNGMNLELLFSQLADVRTHTEIPLVLMGYLNPVYQFGELLFLEKCHEVGIDGLILPDMPLDYFERHLAASFEQHQISNILLITPDTAVERIRYIDSLASGFVYMVSSNSITGGNKDLAPQASYFKRIEGMNLRNPRLIGFGIRDQQSFVNACGHSHGAIVGTAFIQHIAQHGTDFNSIQSFVKSIRP